VKSVRARLELTAQARGEPVSPASVYIEGARILRCEIYRRLLPGVPNPELTPIVT
jgi:hypothetical protein